jgi:hypothetical protein
MTDDFLTAALGSREQRGISELADSEVEIAAFSRNDR